MQRNVVRNLLFIVTACLLVGGSLLAMRMMMAHAAYSQRVTLQAQTVPLIQHAHLMQAADAGLQLDLSIGLQLQNQPGLDQLLHDLSDPQSPRYQQYLTPDQFDQQFAPSSDQVQQVQSYLSSQGITVQGVSSNNLLINASGTVSQIDQAFNTQINMYQSGGQTFYANTTPPSLPASVGTFVASIGGLDNSAQYAPLYQRPTRTPGTGAASASDNGNATPTGLAPKDLASAYDMSPLRDSGLLGDNQTIALFELDGYQQSDVNQYFQNYGLGSPSVTPVLVGGASGSAGSGAIEVELDIEVLAALAPHARQLVYEGPNTFQGINQTYNQIVTDNKAHVVSISWGLCEGSSGNAELQTLDAIFKQGAAQGMTFFAAAGDAGAYDCQDTNLAVDSPASDPYVTGVGGTNLQLASGAYNSEAVWADAGQTQRGPKGAGSGGGISSFFKQPSWQSGNGVQNQYSNGNREVPDVTAVADPATGYSVYCTVTSAGCPAGGWLVLGGTSAAAPLWAGGLTLLNQYLQNNGKAVVGQVNPALYQLFNGQQPYAPFHDVVKGNNLYYAATGGYDVASGLGSPDLYNMVRDLLAQGSGTPTPTPTPSPTPSPTAMPTATPSPTAMPTATPSPTAMPTAAVLLKNGGFENGQSPWQESSSQGYQMVDATNAHSGQYSAYLCGYMGCDDRLWQTFTVPSNFSKITLTYWWYSDTNKTTRQCLDTFVSRLQNSNGSTIRNLQQACNTNATNTWVQESFDVTNDLANYRGKQVTLFYRGTNAQNQYQTSDFFVDDVAISVA